jgi:hypothetical protein
MSENQIFKHNLLDSLNKQIKHFEVKWHYSEQIYKIVCTLTESINKKETSCTLVRINTIDNYDMIYLLSGLISRNLIKLSNCEESNYSISWSNTDELIAYLITLDYDSGHL